MFQSVALWGGGLGIGIFSWLLMMLFVPHRIPERALVILAIIVGGVAVWFQQSSESSAVGFLVVSIICWVFDLIAGLAIYIVVSNKH